MTANDGDWSVFWARGSSRSNPPNGSYLYVGKHVGEDTDTTRTNETIGYIVIEAGSGTFGDVTYRAGVGGDSVRGMTNGPPFNYTTNGPDDTVVAIVSAAGMDGGNGGWPLLYGDDPVSASRLQLAYDEDQIGDTERSHTTEQVAYLSLMSGEVRKYYYAGGQRVAMRVSGASPPSENGVYYLHVDHGRLPAPVQFRALPETAKQSRRDCNIPVSDARADWGCTTTTRGSTTLILTGLSAQTLLYQILLTRKVLIITRMC